MNNEPRADERVAIPARKYTHDDGNRCVLTSQGRWMREGLGISDLAKCYERHDLTAPRPAPTEARQSAGGGER